MLDIEGEGSHLGSSRDMVRSIFSIQDNDDCRFVSTKRSRPYRADRPHYRPRLFLP